MPKKRAPKYNRRDYETIPDEVYFARRLAVLEEVADRVRKLVSESFLSPSDVIVVLDPKTDQMARDLARNAGLSTKRRHIGIGQRADLAATLGPGLAADIEAHLQEPGREGTVSVLTIAHGGAAITPVKVLHRHDVATAN